MTCIRVSEYNVAIGEIVSILNKQQHGVLGYIIRIKASIRQTFLELVIKIKNYHLVVIVQ